MLDLTPAARAYALASDVARRAERLQRMPAQSDATAVRLHRGSIRAAVRMIDRAQGLALTADQRDTLIQLRDRIALDPEFCNIPITTA